VISSPPPPLLPWSRKVLRSRGANGKTRIWSEKKKKQRERSDLTGNLSQSKKARRKFSGGKKF